MKTRDLVIELVATECDIDTIPEASSLDELGVDSPHLLELALAIEERFGIEVPDAALCHFRTIDDVITYVESYVGS